MICLTRPDGGRTWVHESRLEEYLGRGYQALSPLQADSAAVKATAEPKKTTKRSTTKK